MANPERAQSVANARKSGACYTVGVDIGGTFTDCVIVDDAGRIIAAKVETTPNDRSEGFFASIDRAAEKIGISVSELLSRCQRIVHGTTVGTNAIVERDGAVIGLITTAGHGDVMYLMRGSGRTSGLPPDELLNVPRTNKPEPLVPKHHILEVAERIDVDGDVVVPLDEDAVRNAVAQLVDDGVEAIAISLLWSMKNPDHEQRVKELAREVAPAVFLTCGSDLVSRVGEYERTTTSLMNAYIGPLMARYVEAIEKGANQRGYERSVLFAQCAGGAITAKEAEQSPILTVQSGPVAGIMGSKLLAERIGEPNVIATDMGGTTFDVTVIRDGEPLHRDVSVFQRYELALPMLDVESIGAGGGSIAWIDDSGRLNVGPRSAGADPGPACYGRGSAATVTDADLVLGILDPERFLHGRMRLDCARAEAAVGELARQLGLGLHETAAGISRIVDAKMADLIRRMSVLRGFDPRSFTCFAFGGGGPVHAGAVAKEAGIRKVIVPLPAVAALWSAFGAATSDITHVYQEAHLIDLPVTGAEISTVFERLELSAVATLETEGFGREAISLRRSVRMKYAMQVYDVEVAVQAGTLTDADVETIDRDFGVVYEELFGKGSGYREGGVQITGFHVHASGLTSKPDLPRIDHAAGGASPVSISRKIYWDERRELIETPVLRIEGEMLFDEAVGPMLIELPDTVIVVRPDQTAHLDRDGNVVIEVV